MVSIPFGLSVHHFVSSVGADVGFASLIGLALLVLLFFSQARETATLRTRADEAGLRIQELEGELADMAEQIAALPAEISVRAASPRVAAAFGAAQPGGAAVSTMPPAAPAGVAAPALAAATRLIPDPDYAVPTYGPATAAGNGNGSARPVVAASAATVERSVGARPANAPHPVAAPARVGAGGGPGGRGPGTGQVRPAGPGQPRPAGPGQVRQAGPARPSGVPLRPPARRSRGRIVFGVLLGAVAVAAAVVGVIALTGGKTASSASHSSSSATLGSHRSSSSDLVAVQPSTVTVSVLNGTDMQGLAGHVAQQLTGVGYRKGSVTNASDQTQASTVVAYMAPAERRDALAVARTLKLSQASVHLIDPNTKAIVCPPSQPCTSMVVVTVGKDLASQ